MNKRKEVRGFWAKGTTCSREEIRNRCLDGRDAEENAEHGAAEQVGGRAHRVWPAEFKEFALQTKSCGESQNDTR